MSAVERVAITPARVDIAEVRRNAGLPAGEDALLEDVIAEGMQKAQYRLCRASFGVRFEDEFTDLGFARTESRSLRRHLAGSHRCVIFAATLGLEYDLLMRRYEQTAPARALLLHALGTERIEALCEAFCENVGREAAPGEKVLPRFSPGYGDLPLTFQRPLLAALDCPRQIGLTLTAECLMIPSKSVSAIVGIR